jgi:hypothetical protein
MRLLRFCQIAFFLLFLSFGLVQQTSGQKNSFIYLQSDEQQPFYVTVNGRNISSSSIGYVIISKIPDGNLPIRIGFPNSNNVQDYDLKVDGNDQGYLIKNFGQKGWGLFNLQTLDVQISDAEVAKRDKDNIAKKEAEEKRVADSIAVETAKLDAVKKADSIKSAIAAQELELKRLDSLRLIAAAQEEEIKKAELAKATALAEERTKAEALAANKEAKRIADSTAKANTAAAKKKAVVDKTKQPVVKDTKTKEVAENKKPVDAATKEVNEAVVVVPNTTVKEQEIAKKVVITRQDDSVPDSGKLTADKDGKDKVKVIGGDSSSEKEMVIDDTIVIKVPARSIAKTENTLPATLEKPVDTPEKKSDPLTGKKFLDIEINHDSTLIKPEAALEQNGAKVETKEIEKLVPPTVGDTPNQAVKTGLTPNNSNTKIVVAPTVDSTRDKQQPVDQARVEAENDTSKGKKGVGLTSNNPTTKIVVVPTVPVENAPVEKAKVDTPNIKTEVITAPVEQPKVEEVKADSVVPAASVPAPANLACKELATDKDFFNARKSMVMGADADEMIMAGKKAFKEKCFSTAQIRNLCVLFLSDADRYSFLDAAYPYTSDSGNFVTLSDLLKETYYLNRFKAMLK